MPCAGDAFEGYDLPGAQLALIVGRSPKAQPGTCCVACQHLSREAWNVLLWKPPPEFVFGKCLGPDGYAHAAAAGIELEGGR